MRTLVATAADEAYLPLLRGLIASLRQWQPAPFTDLACFDVGLSPAGREWAGARVSTLVEPGWDLPVAQSLRRERPALRAATVRPFLPRYFPGYDVYLWVDADAWVQQREALAAYLELAARGSLVAVPEVDRVYRPHPSVVRWRVERLAACYGDALADRALWDTYFNAGVYALSSTSQLWERWAQSFEIGLRNSGGTLCCDQSALNHALWTAEVSVVPLPATYNWLCHLAMPRWEPRRGLYCEPAFPGRPIGVVHLTGRTKSVVSAAPGDEAGAHAAGPRFDDARPRP